MVAFFVCEEGRGSVREVLFLDESGDHSLTSIAPQYPVFVLGGVIIAETYANGELTERVNAFKRELFGREDIILHTADIARNKSGFERLKDPAFRQHFYGRLNALMQVLEYKVVACAINKEEHVAIYGRRALDPYFYSLEVLIERFAYEIGERYHTGVIVAEGRKPVLDAALDLAWQSIRLRGTRYFKARDIRKRVKDLMIRPKQENIAGLQLADLVVSPIGRFVLGKETHEDFRIIEAKFRRRANGDYRGAGLVILPKEMEQSAGTATQ